MGAPAEALDSGQVRNAMTVDVEDYFQVSAFESHVDKATWDSFPKRVEDNTLRILDLFARHEVRGTFFMLGWVAERHPGLVKAIVEAGHELASHGWEHIRVNTQTPEAFRDDIDASRNEVQLSSNANALAHHEVHTAIELFIKLAPLD